MVRDNEYSSIKCWLYGYFPAVVFFLLIVISVFIATTYSLSYKPMLVMEKWSCEGKIGSAQDWEQAEQNLLLASKINPWDADIYFNLGNLYEWKAVGEVSWNKASKEMRQKSTDYFREALLHRPTWANAWVKLAQTMLLNRQLSDEAFNAIEKGFKYGQWQPEIADQLVWLSIGVWSSLPEDLKAVVRAHVKHQIVDKNSLTKYAVIATRFRWFDELVKLTSDNDFLKYIELVKANPKLLKGGINESMGVNKNYVC